jgi:hypothetical protein
MLWYDGYEVAHIISGRDSKNTAACEKYIAFTNGWYLQYYRY